MTRAEYVEAPPREWLGTLSYPGNPKSLRVAVIGRFTPADLVGYPRMSSSSGPKDYLKNSVHALLSASGGDEVILVRASGPVFAVLRKGDCYFDGDGDVIELRK